MTTAAGTGAPIDWRHHRPSANSAGIAAEGRRDAQTTAAGVVRTPLTIEAAAERLGVTPRMVRRLVNERRIGFVRVGKFIRRRPDDVDVYLEQHFEPPLDRRAAW